MELTKQQKWIVYLRLLGFEPVINNRSSKFLGFTKMKMTKPWPGASSQMTITTYWVGKNGAFRMGRTISESISCTPNWPAVEAAWKSLDFSVVDSFLNTNHTKYLSAS